MNYSQPLPECISPTVSVRYEHTGCATRPSSPETSSRRVKNLEKKVLRCPRAIFRRSVGVVVVGEFRSICSLQTRNRICWAGRPAVSRAISSTGPRPRPSKSLSSLGHFLPSSRVDEKLRAAERASKRAWQAERMRRRRHKGTKECFSLRLLEAPPSETVVVVVVVAVVVAAAAAAALFAAAS